MHRKRQPEFVKNPAIRANLSPGVMRGEIHVTETQFLNSEPDIQALLVPVHHRGCTTYRYLYADPIAATNEDSNPIDAQFARDVEMFCSLLDDANTENDEYYLFQIDLDPEDVDYLIGVCYTGLQSMFETDALIQVEHQFGDFWSAEILWNL